MKRSAGMGYALSLAAICVSIGPEICAAADNAAATQELAKVVASDQVTTAVWTRQPDFYTLRVVLDVAAYEAKQRARSGNLANGAAGRPNGITEEDMRALGIVNVAEVLRQPVPQHLPQAFVGNEIANLRGIDPWFHCARTLGSTDGRRGVNQSGGTVPMTIPPPRGKDSRVEVWLLKADGTPILPAGYSCVVEEAEAGKAPATGALSYRFSVADGSLAASTLVRIDDEFFIEKLQKLELKVAVQ